MRAGSVGQRAILRVKFRRSAVSPIITALVAQWIEHPPPKGRVTRSIRVEGTTVSPDRYGAIFRLRLRRMFAQLRWLGLPSAVAQGIGQWRGWVNVLLIRRLNIFSCRLNNEI